MNRHIYQILLLAVAASGCGGAAQMGGNSSTLRDQRAKKPITTNVDQSANAEASPTVAPSGTNTGVDQGDSVTDSGLVATPTPTPSPTPSPTPTTPTDPSAWATVCPQLTYIASLAPVVITTAAQLRQIVSDGHYELGADIQLSGDWASLGALDAHGTDGPKASTTVILDGKGHTIAGMRINGDVGGLFAHLDCSLIENLTFQNPYILGATTFFSYGNGALASRAENSYISNVHVTGLDAIVSTSGSGGLIAKSIGSTLVDVSTSGTLNTTQYSNIDGMGGVVGSMYGSNHGPSRILRGSSSVNLPGQYAVTGGIVGFIIDGVDLDEVWYSGTIGSPAVFTHSGGIVGAIGSCGGQVVDDVRVANALMTGTIINQGDGLIGAVSFCADYRLKVESSINNATLVGSPQLPSGLLGRITRWKPVSASTKITVLGSYYVDDTGTVPAASAVSFIFIASDGVDEAAFVQNGDPGVHRVTSAAFHSAAAVGGWGLPAAWAYDEVAQQPRLLRVRAP